MRACIYLPPEFGTGSIKNILDPHNFTQIILCCYLGEGSLRNSSLQLEHTWQKNVLNEGWVQTRQATVGLGLCDSSEAGPGSLGPELPTLSPCCLRCLSQNPLSDPSPCWREKLWGWQRKAKRFGMLFCHRFALLVFLCIGGVDLKSKLKITKGTGKPEPTWRSSFLTPSCAKKISWN